VPDDTVRIGGAPVYAGATYRITVNSFLADGGDGFGVLRSGSNRAVSGLAVDTFAQYLSANRPISAPATDASERPVAPRTSRHGHRATPFVHKMNENVT